MKAPRQVTPQVLVLESKVQDHQFQYDHKLLNHFGAYFQHTTLTYYCGYSFLTSLLVRICATITPRALANVSSVLRVTLRSPLSTEPT